MTPEQTKLRDEYELEMLREYICPHLSPDNEKRKINRAILEWAYQRLLADRCVPLRKVA